MIAPTLARELIFSFDLPPSLNRLYKHGKGRVYISQEGTDYKEYAMLTAYSQGAAIMEGALAVNLDYYGANADIDNLQKCLFDALNGVAWHDDSQIMELHIYKHAASKGDCWVDVRIKGMK